MNVVANAGESWRSEGRSGALVVVRERISTTMLAWDDVAMTADHDGSPWACEDRGHIFFVTLFPIPADLGPMEWHELYH